MLASWIPAFYFTPLLHEWYFNVICVLRIWGVCVCVCFYIRKKMQMRPPQKKFVSQTFAKKEVLCFKKKKRK